MSFKLHMKIVLFLTQCVVRAAFFLPLIFRESFVRVKSLSNDSFRKNFSEKKSFFSSRDQKESRKK